MKGYPNHTKLLSLLLCFVLVLGQLPAVAAAEEVPCTLTEGYTGFLDAEGNCSVCSVPQPHSHSYVNGLCSCGSTCSHETYAEGLCTLCGASEPVSCDHSWNEGTVTTAATCTAEGVMTFACTKEGCGETRTEPVTQTSHTYANGSCTVCGACEHSWDEGTVTVESTCAEKGTIAFTCIGCGQVRTASLAMGDHVFENGVCTGCGACEHSWDEGTVTVPATCTAEGTMTFSCTREGCEETKTETTEIASHTYDNGSCTVCGALEVKCICSVPCSETVNTDCPVCSAEGGLCTAIAMPAALYFSDQDKTWGSEVKAVYTDAAGNITEVLLSASSRGYFYSGQVPAGTVSFYFTDGTHQTQPMLISQVLELGTDMCVIFDGSEEWMEFSTWSQMNPLAAVAKIGDTPYESLKDAVTAANTAGTATIELVDDITLGEKLTIAGNVTIAGPHTITRAPAYTGTFFTVNSGMSLTLDGGLVIDGGNNYSFDRDGYLADCASRVTIADSTKWFSPEAGAPVASAFMITTTGGSVNLFDVTIQNNYSTNNGVISAGANSSITLTGAKITHVASTANSGVIANVSGANIIVTVNEGTVIDGNHVGGNHGLFKIYSGATVILNGGSITNTTGWNSNGIVAGIYYGTLIMNGGTICSNSSTRGPNNGRNAAIYGHQGHTFIMSGGTICHNSGGYGGLDAPYVNGKTEIRGGSIANNTSLSNNPYPDIFAGTQLVITGGIFTQDVSTWVPEDLRTPQVGGSTWGVGIAVTSSSSGTAAHASIQEAINSLSNSAEDVTITLLKDISLTEDSTFSKACTVDAGGYTVTGEKSWTIDEPLTIQNLGTEGNNISLPAGGKLTFDTNGTVTIIPTPSDYGYGVATVSHLDNGKRVSQTFLVSNNNACLTLSPDGLLAQVVTTGDNGEKGEITTLPYQLIPVNSQNTYIQSSAADLKFESNMFFSVFKDAYLDVVDSEHKLKLDTDYTAEPGSTHITLNNSLLRTLSLGKHTLFIEGKDGHTVPCDFFVSVNLLADPTNPKTGDDFNMVLYSTMAVTSLLCLAAVTLTRKKVF